MSDLWERTSFGKVARRRTETWSPGDPEAIYVGLEHISPYELRLLGAGVSTAVSSNKTRFLAHDVLFGKLRPYFQKVVRPSFPGVCSTDIWALYPADDSQVDPGFLHWVVADPSFSDFANSAETGTRMPRASWQWVSTYELALPPLEEQRRIAEVLGALDDRIDSLVRSERLVLDFGLTQLEIALEAGEVRPIRVDEVATFENRKRIPLSQMERDKRPGPYPYYGATGIFGYVDDYLFDGFRVLVGEDGSVIEDDGTPVLQLAHGKYWVNNHAHVLAGRAVATEALWFLLRNLAVDPAVTGAVQPKLSMGRLAALEVLVPSEASPFFAVAKECIAQVLHRREQLRDMIEARDFLLPRLVSGELRVAAAEELVEAAT